MSEAKKDGAEDSVAKYDGRCHYLKILFIFKLSHFLEYYFFILAVKKKKFTFRTLLNCEFFFSGTFSPFRSTDIH